MPGTGAHRYSLRVYYDDTDAGGVVYHANYLRMAERARTEALRAAGVAHAELTSQHGLIFVVRRINLDYIAPARLDDLLVVVTESVALGSASVELRQSIFREDPARKSDLPTRPLVVAEVTLVCVGRSAEDPQRLVAARIPQRWRAALAPPAAA
jgi:acyl-CoA thioester hydrolase